MTRRYSVSRRDALPEHGEWKDTGCAVHPACLSCPLERCVYDEAPHPQRVRASAARRRQVLALREQGQGVEAIAEVVGISRRQIYRLLGEAAPPATVGVSTMTADELAAWERRMEGS